MKKDITVEAKERLKYLRGEIEAERISYGEIAELMSLVDYIDKDDVLLLEWAGVPEFETHIPKDFPVQPTEDRGPNIATCGQCGLSWDDEKSTEWTPAPSGRCPFEYFHN